MSGRVAGKVALATGAGQGQGAAGDRFSSHFALSGLVTLSSPGSTRILALYGCL
jgi:hypothetical protein